MRILPFLLLLAAPLAAQAPTVTIPRVDTTVTIDGVLDEPVWLQATRLDGFRQYQPVDGRPAEDSTVVLVWYAPEAIHVGIRAYDRQPGSVRATVADRDNIGSDDKVTIYLDTFNDRRRAYFFGVNPLGAQDDGTRSEGGFSTSGGGFGAGSTDRNPDFLWDSKGRLTPWGWEAEIRIPFKSLRWGGGEVQTWGFQVERVTQRTGYTDTWTDVRRGNASFLGQAGTITGIRDISRGMVVELQPTFVADAPGVRGSDGAFRRDDITPEVGANLRLGFTNLTLDATINPDFSQVESDVGLVTINERFALFFPERRPFFLEGIDLFATPNQLVYTRTVANPIAGGKVTGKFGRWSVAHLSAIDEFTQSGAGGSDPPDAFANITRVRRDLGDNSVAGVTVTNRDEGGNYNRVVAADTRLVFGTVYYFAAQAGVSTTRVESGDDHVSYSDPIWELELDRTGRAFGFNHKVTAVGRDFETWSGFVNRTNVVNARFSNRYRYYGPRGALLEELTVFGSLGRYWEYGDLFGSEALEGSNSVNFSANLRGGWGIRLSPELGFVRFHPDDYTGYAVSQGGGTVPFAVPSGVFDALSTSLNVNTPTWKTWNASFSVAGGESAIFPEAAEARSLRLTGSVSLRPSDLIRVGGSLTFQRLTRSADGSEFARTILPRVRVEVQPNRALFFRAIAEYRSERRAALQDPASGLPLVINGTTSTAQRTDRLRLDLLGSFEPTPGTVAFLGYGSTLRGDRPLTFRELERTDDAFFVKLAYLMRW